MCYIYEFEAESGSKELASRLKKLGFIDSATEASPGGQAKPQLPDGQKTGALSYFLHSR